MRIDIVIPTYKRPSGLRKLVDSILAANCPDGLDVGIIVVDNNSGDDTEAVVREYANSGPTSVRYVCEVIQGSSAARNAGIRVANGDLVGLLDDDEQIDPHWLEVVAEAFADSTVDFIGGPCLPDWSVEPPSWIPPHYPAVIGWVDGGPDRIPFDDHHDIMLMSGNAVLRRSVFSTAGYFSTSLGRTATRLLCGEDEEFYFRLRQSGARGYYHPELRILHWVPKERLTKMYYRRWAFWRAVSQGLQDRMAAQKVPRLFGLPRWRIRSGITAFFRSLRFVFGSAESLRFQNELDAISFVGFVYGRFIFRLATPG